VFLEADSKDLDVELASLECSELPHAWLWWYVMTHLARGCSLEQIAQRLKRGYPEDIVLNKGSWFSNDRVAG